MRASTFQCSSRRTPKLPVLLAFWGTGGRHSEKGSGGSKFTQHNMGLCCILGQGGGSGVAYPIFFRRAGR